MHKLAAVKLVLVFLFAGMLSSFSNGSFIETDPKQLTWQILSDVEFKSCYIEELDSFYWKPEFGQQVKNLDGQDVYITGYMIPVEVENDFYVLSRYPFANCYFCGGAGPESILDLRFKKGEERKYKTDERLTFKGKLKLNADDVYQLNYLMLNAEEM